jgi:pSer/pThr/pTyr-binding forkhead associated (FHA) protein
VRRRSRQAAQHAPLPVLAELREMSGVEVVHEIRKSGVTIGRDQINDIVLRNSSVSSRHAELHRARTGAFILSDLGSTNGITLNGERVTAAELRSGDIVEIAEVRLRFTLHG